MHLRSTHNLATSSRRAGFTLTEMIVVILIIVILAAVTVPVAMRFSEGRRARDAARTVQAVLAGARDRAMGAGYPVGVRLIQESSDPSIVRSMAYIRQPLPQTLGKAVVAKDTNGVFKIVRLLTFPKIQKLKTLRWNGVKFVGQIRFEQASKYYSFTTDNALLGTGTTPPVLELDEPLPYGLPSDPAPTNAAMGVNYRIPFGSEPLEDVNPIRLPDGVVIDLGSIPANNFNVAAASDRLSRVPVDSQSGLFDILFSPGGQLMGSAAADPVLVLWIREELAAVEETQIYTTPATRQKRVKLPVRGTHVLMGVFGKTGSVKSAEPVFKDTLSESRANATSAWTAGTDGFVDHRDVYENLKTSASSNF